MHIAFFSTKPYDRRFFEEANEEFGHQLDFLEARLTAESASLAGGSAAVCVFVNDVADAPVLRALEAVGTRLIALRCAGFNNVAVRRASDADIGVVRVPAYSPYAVAEHTMALILTLNRQVHRAHSRVRESNFELEGLLEFDLHGRTVGIIGAGKIGSVLAKICAGFDCRILVNDIYPSPEVTALGGTYTTLDDLLAESDIVSLHCPLTPETRHMINERTLALMRRGAMLINTSRGGLVDTRAVIQCLKTGHLGYLGLDVYEEEADLFFRNLSGQVIQGDVFARLLTFPNVLITGHQAFFTEDALRNIARTTLSNISAFERGDPSGNEVTPEMVVHA